MIAIPLKIFFYGCIGGTKEAMILAKWLMGVTVGLAESHPDNTHHQPGPCLHHRSFYVLLRFFGKATSCRFHQRMCNAGCCDTTTGANLDTNELAETPNCKLFISQLFELKLDDWYICI